MPRTKGSTVKNLDERMEEIRNMEGEDKLVEAIIQRKRLSTAKDSHKNAIIMIDKVMGELNGFIKELAK